MSLPSHSRKRKKWTGEKRLIFAEGTDFKLFTIWALDHTGLLNDDVFVQEITAIDNIETDLRDLKKSSHFNKLTDLLIVKDSEGKSREESEKSIRNAISSAFESETAPPTLPTEMGMFSERTVELPRIAYYLATKEECDDVAGTLEGICLWALYDRTAHNMAVDFVARAEEEFRREANDSDGNSLSYVKTPHKAKIAAALAVARSFDKESGSLRKRGGEFAPFKIAEAAKAGAFDWGHEKLKPFLSVLRRMCEDK